MVLHATRKSNSQQLPRTQRRPVRPVHHPPFAQSQLDGNQDFPSSHKHSANQGQTLRSPRYRHCAASYVPRLMQQSALRRSTTPKFGVEIRAVGGCCRRVAGCGSPIFALLRTSATWTATLSIGLRPRRAQTLITLNQVFPGQPSRLPPPFLQASSCRLTPLHTFIPSSVILSSQHPNNVRPRPENRPLPPSYHFLAPQLHPAKTRKKERVAEVRVMSWILPA